MTTIAYADGVLAADGRETLDGVIISDSCRKIVMLDDGRYMAFCGDSDCRAAVKLFHGGGEPSVSELRELKQDHGIIVADPVNRTLLYFMCSKDGDGGSEDGVISLPTERPFARGSGGDFALGAMLAGATAVEAVKAAKKADPNSGGRIVSVDLW